MNVWVLMFAIMLILAIPLGYVVIFGKTILERLAALDTIGAMGVASLMFFSAYSGRTIYMDIALTLALLDFLGNLAFARFIWGRWQ